MRSIFKLGWNSPYFLLTMATLFWGGNAVAGRFLAPVIPPLTLSFIRLLLSSLFVLPFIYPILIKEWPAAKRNFGLVVLLALTGVIGFNLLTYFAAHYTAAVNIALLNSMNPLFMVLLAYFLIREKMTVRLLLSIMISLAGVLWVMTQGSVERLLALQFNYGDLLMLAAVLFWSIYSIYVKKLAGQVSSLALFGFSSILGTGITLPAAAVELSLSSLGPISFQAVLAVLYVSIFPSICSFLSWNRAVELIGPSRSSVFSNFIPIWAAVLAFILIGESITGAHILGGLLVFAGIFLSRTKSGNNQGVPTANPKSAES